MNDWAVELILKYSTAWIIYYAEVLLDFVSLSKYVGTLKQATVTAYPVMLTPEFSLNVLT
jgi:hypothetical protein